VTSDLRHDATISRAEARSLAAQRRFYASSISEANSIVFNTARGMGGLDEEIAMLRMEIRKFRGAGKDTDANAGADADATPSPKDSFLPLLQGLDVLRKMVAARYRMSGDAERQLDFSLARLIQGVFAEFKAGASYE
jgi:hypothetical protein